MKIFQTSKKSVTKIKKICYLCRADSSLKRYPRSRPRLPPRGPRDVPGASAGRGWRTSLPGASCFPGDGGPARGSAPCGARLPLQERTATLQDIAFPGVGLTPGSAPPSAGSPGTGGRPPPLSSASSIQAGPVGPPAAVHHHPKCYHPPPSRDAGGFLMRNHLPGNGKDAPCRARPADMVYVEDVGLKTEQNRLTASASRSASGLPDSFASVNERERLSLSGW